MSETSTNALFINDEAKFIREDNGEIIFLRTTPPTLKCWLAHLRKIGEPSQEFVVMTRLMALIKVRKPSVSKS